jgi:predicted Holliday junction resolvase-like endonuclease
VFRGRVCAGSEDILLSEVTASVRARVIGRASYAKRSECKQDYEIAKRNIDFNKNIKKSGPLIMGKGGSRLVLYIDLILA